MAAGATPEDPLIGRAVAGKYLIESCVGIGAMGTVYRARQISLDKTIALKILRRDLEETGQFVDRFRVEAKAASKLDHPNSTRVIDFGREPDGLLYIAMEYLDGRSLYDVVDEQSPLSEERIVRIMTQALAAIAVAHDMGVLHRDLKPENIMILRQVDDEGNATDLIKVCDFGIAKLAGGEMAPGGARLPAIAMPPGRTRRLTLAGMVIGTPAYMSPEQASCREIDARSDIYSLGVILFELLTGRLPFDDPAPDALARMHLSVEPPHPRDIKPSVSPELAAVCVKALQKDPATRYAGAREMRADLRAALAAGESARSERIEPSPPDTLIPPADETPPDELASRLDAAESDTLVAHVEGLASLKASQRRTDPSRFAPTRSETRARRVGPRAALAVTAAAVAVFALLRPQTASVRGPSDDGATSSAVGASAPPPPTLQPAADGTTAATIATAATAAVESAESSATASASLRPSSREVRVNLRGVRASDQKPGASRVRPPEPDVVATSEESAEPAAPAITVSTPTSAIMAPAPSPLAPQATPSVSPPSFDPARAHFAIGSLTADHVSARDVTAVIARADLTACFTAVARAARVAPPSFVTLKLDIDDLRVVDASVAPAAAAPMFRGCVAKVKGGRTPSADTGAATARIVLTLTDK